MNTMTHGSIDLETVRRAAEGQWVDRLLPQLGFVPKHLTGRHGPCPRCGGTDRFRLLDARVGAVICNQCFSKGNGDGFAAIMWRNDWTFRRTLETVADILDLGASGSETHPGDANATALDRWPTPDGGDPDSGDPDDADVVKKMARLKRIPLESFIAFGAHSAMRGKLVVARVPMFDQHRNPCSYFDLADFNDDFLKGMSAKKSDETPGVGLFVAEWPEPGEVVLITEGVKDAGALHSLGFKAVGLPTSKLAAKFARVFSGCDVVIVPDLDVTGIDSADTTAARLRGIANTVRIARLPGEIRATKGDGVREVLARADGEADLRQAIQDAVLWQPFPEGSQANGSDEYFEESHSSGRGCKRSGRKPCKATSRSRHNTWTPICTDQGRTDIANSRRFVDANRTRIRFCHSWGKWLVWTGRKWEIDCDGSIIRMAKEIADTLWAEAKHCPTKEVVNFAVSTSCRQKIQAMQELATPEVAVRVDELDAQPWLLNCPNGVVDLRTGELRPHQPEDHLTKLCPTNFNPHAESKCWDRFLESVFGGDEETITFVQRYFGYCLTGSVTEQVLTVCYGGGSNGKSTLLNAIQTTMGADYASAAPPGLLTEKKNEAHPTELAGLFGLRLAIAQETAQGEKLAEPIIKQLTGGDRISARRMREDFWNFMPTHKLILVTNHKPRVKGTDHAIWRRLVLIPFERRFWNPAKGESGPPELCQDKDLATKLAAESEAILAWMVRGCIDWHHDGLKIPCSVRAATDEYRTEQDVLGRFMRDIFVPAEHCQIKFSDLYTALERWCYESGDFKPSKKFVGAWLKDNGYKEKQSGVRWYLGIGFKPQLE